MHGGLSPSNLSGLTGRPRPDTPWLVRPERIEEEEPDKAIDALDLKPGMNVADIGAGVSSVSGCAGTIAVALAA